MIATQEIAAQATDQIGRTMIVGAVVFAVVAVAQAIAILALS